MKYVISYLSLFIAIIFAAACSDISDDITTPEEVGIHPEGISNSSSNNFHGKLLGDNGFTDCQQCHASDLSGGVAGVSCSTGECHVSIGVHKEGIKNPSSDNFHAKFLKNKGLLMSECSQCHGSNYQGSNSAPTCQNCHNGIDVHKDGVTAPSSDNFHGKYLVASNHKLEDCSQCHGDNYAGGLVSSSCNDCHTQQEGPEACNTCHGDFSKPEVIVPNNGAHEKHLFESELAVQYAECMLCHEVPSNFEDEGHIDENPGAEVAFNGFSSENGSFNRTTMTCENVYCHGSFEFLKSESSFQAFYTADKMEGNNFNPNWNILDGTQAACGTCHGLPPTGHIPASLSSCANCHSGVVDGEGNIIDDEKHINGAINVFGN